MSHNCLRNYVCIWDINHIWRLFRFIICFNPDIKFKEPRQFPMFDLMTKFCLCLMQCRHNKCNLLIHEARAAQNWNQKRLLLIKASCFWKKKRTISISPSIWLHHKKSVLCFRFFAWGRIIVQSADCLAPPFLKVDHTLGTRGQIVPKVVQYQTRSG